MNKCRPAIRRRHIGRRQICRHAQSVAVGSVAPRSVDGSVAPRSVDGSVAPRSVDGSVEVLVMRVVLTVGDERKEFLPLVRLG
jgi:hypothetical protein